MPRRCTFLYYAFTTIGLNMFYILRKLDATAIVAAAIIVVRIFAAALEVKERVSQRIVGT